MKPSSFSILIIFTVASMLGIFVTPRLAIKINPSYQESNIYVNCSWSNSNAETIEKQVTSVLEGAFNTIKGIKSMASQTRKDACGITLTFNKHTHMQTALYEVNSVIRNIYQSLPKEVSYPNAYIGGQSTEHIPFLTYSLVSSLQPFQIQKMAQDELLPRLTDLQGIHDVRIYGANGKQWHVKFDQQKLKSLNIDYNELIQAIYSLEKKEKMGIGSYKENEYSVVISNFNPEEWKWEDIPIKKSGEKIIYLKQVAKATLEDIAPGSYYRINGLNTINLTITPSEKSNQVKLAKQAKAIIEQVEKKWQGQVRFVLKKDDSKFIQSEIKKIVSRSVLTFFMLILFVWLVSLNFRYLFIIFLSILANLSIAFLIYYFLGVELHLYSFAGITVSMGIIIDNSIVMVDHLWHQRNRKVFLALLASTVTTIGALSVIFFLSERLVLNMLDFALVIVVNLLTSLFIALFLIPALMEKIPLIQGGKHKIWRKRKKRIVWISSWYLSGIAFVSRFKWAFVIALILAFGLPVQYLPDKLGKSDEELNLWQSIYNNTIGSEFYIQHLKKYVNYTLGGTLRLFTDEVNHSNYYQSNERTNLVVAAQMPVGARTGQMNDAFILLEKYLQQFKEIEQFETFVYGYNNARMVIYFKKAYESGYFPYLLKNLLISNALSVGSADWQVYGYGQGFNNSLKEQIGSYRINLYGYNYQQLYRYAEQLRDTLLRNLRVKEVNIMGHNAWYRSDNFQYVLKEDPEKVNLSGGNLINTYNEMKAMSLTRQQLTYINQSDKRYPVVISAQSAPVFNIWDLKHSPLTAFQKSYKLNHQAGIQKERLPSAISRINQQYYLLLEYDFIGSWQLGRHHLKKTIEAFSEKLAVGYQAKTREYDFSSSGKEKNEQIYMILVVILIIYFVCAILLESLWQPLAIISMIPISFMGVFLSFYLFELNFDQGGFAAFILLSGLTVNAALFIINDFNNLKIRKGIGRSDAMARHYIKAFNTKIIPILLSISSTIIGLSPYLFSGQKENFWFSLAVGSSGGLAFSLIAIYVYLPIFFVKKTIKQR